MKGFNSLIYDPVNYYDYGLCSEQSAKFCKLDEFKEPDLNFLFSNIQRWLVSPKRKEMVTAERYYKNQNDILDRKRYFIGRNGQKIENKNVSNNRLSHPFFRKLVNQKIGYLLGKDIDFTAEEKYKTYIDILLKDYFNKDFRQLAKIILRESIVKGVAWVQVYYDDQGKLSFTVIPSEEIFPFWGDSLHTKLDGIIRCYMVQHFKADGSVWPIKRAELYTRKGSWKFTLNNGEIMEDEKTGHFIANDQPQNWTEIPFIAFKFNEMETSLLNFIKPLIDAYDITTSDFSNLLSDVPNSIKVVKNYERAENEEEDSFSQNLAMFRTIFVRGDGDVKALDNPIDANAVETHLKRLKKDLYEAASGVEDTNDDNNRADPSGVALQFKYNSLDIEAKNIANFFEHGFQNLKFFIDQDLIMKHQGDFSEVELQVTFNYNLLTNDSNTIDTIIKLSQAGLISLDSAINLNPMIEDQAEELERVKQEKDEKEAKEQEQMNQQFQQQQKLQQAKQQAKPQANKKQKK